MLLLSEVSRNLPLLTLSRHQSAFGFFLRKNMTLLFQPMMKKSIFWCFFSAYVCMELKVGFRKLRKKWGSSKDLISPPRPSFSFSVLKNSVLHERTSSLLTQTYILSWRDIFSRNFSWKWFHEIFSGTESLAVVVLPAVLVLSAYHFLLFDFLKG